MEMTKLIVGLLLGLVNYTLAETFNCYSCSYTLSGDPTYDYECVNQPWNITGGARPIPCTTPYQCVTKALLSQDSKTIRSVTRNCLPPSGICAGENCCSTVGTYPSCEHKCRSDMCNNGNAEQWLKKGSGAKKHYSIPGHILIIALSLRFFMY